VALLVEQYTRNPKIWSKIQSQRLEHRHRTLKNANSCWSTKITFYLETSGGQNSNLHLFIFSTPMFIRHLWQLKKVGFLHWCLLRGVLLEVDGQ
jgi:hypothetical protein